MVSLDRCGHPLKLVYVLNRYARNESSHFVHVINFLQTLATQGVAVSLIIEKAIDVPTVTNPGIEIICIRKSNKFLRLLRLTNAIRSTVLLGESVVFVRIAVPATLAAIVACIGTSARVYYWQSGTVHTTDRAAHKGLEKALWLVRSWLPFRLAVWGIDHFATGPECMVGYYRDEVGIPSRKLVTLYNDIDVSRFRNRLSTLDRAAERARLGCERETVVLLFVHRLSPVRKTMRYVPAILDALRNGAGKRWVMVFVGGGPDGRALREAIDNARLNAHCKLLGEVSNDELASLYCAADIFVNPSYAEGFPRVILEAMAAGLPIVATDAGGTRELLGPAQQRYVVSRDEPERFADAVISLVGDQSAQRILGSENLEAVRRFDTPNVAAMYRRELFG